MCITFAQNQGFLVEWLLPYLQQEIHKISEGCHVVSRKRSSYLKVKESCQKHKGTNMKGVFWPKMGQFVSNKNDNQNT